MNSSGSLPAPGEVVFRRDVAAVWSITFGESVILLTSGATLEVLGSNGSLAWKVELADVSQSARAADGMVLAGTGQKTVAFDEETGREVWRGDGLVSRTGEGFAILKASKALRIVKAATGELLASLGGRVRDARFTENGVAIIVRNTLYWVQKDAELRTLIEGLSGARRITAMADGIVVVRHTDPPGSEPRPQLFTCIRSHDRRRTLAPCVQQRSPDWQKPTARR